MGDDLESPPQSEGAYDELLSSVPRGSDLDSCLERANAQYINKDQQFMRDGRGYSCQYAQIYFQRLTVLKSVLLERVAQEWPGLPVANILELESGKECCVIGTVFKEMKLKPSIMNEYASDPVVAPALAGGKLIDPSDSVIIEDDGARMAVSAAPSLGTTLQEALTGVIAAVRGKDNEGVFEVDAVIFPGIAPQPPLPVREDNAYVAVLSGLGIGSSDRTGELSFRLQLAADYLVGLLGSTQDQATAAKVVRVVIAGGSLEQETPSVLGIRAAPRAKSIAVEPVRDADLALTQIAAGVPLDIMPGASDPATASLPQQPMHRCLFPGASAFPTVTRATNPHSFEVGGVSFLGSSGQTIDDAYRFTPCDDRLGIMESMLEWRHLSPTSPDTLPTFPFSDRDPFIIEQTPHCFFVGNQPAYDTRKVTGPGGQEVRLISVPKFSDTGMVVLVNLRTLACKPIHFEASLLQ